MNSRVSTKCGQFLGQLTNCPLASCDALSPRHSLPEDLNADISVPCSQLLRAVELLDSSIAYTH